ncbi:hypothetical protein GGS20DRAFT_587498 [Poronia punctata]|nr:hypothetical protein GGS20DRAFT_587498 [Poronia punctata]
MPPLLHIPTSGSALIQRVAHANLQPARTTNIIARFQSGRGKYESSPASPRGKFPQMTRGYKSSGYKPSSSKLRGSKNPNFANDRTSRSPRPKGHKVSVPSALMRKQPVPFGSVRRVVPGLSELREKLGSLEGSDDALKKSDAQPQKPNTLETLRRGRRMGPYWHPLKSNIGDTVGKHDKLNQELAKKLHRWNLSRAKAVIPPAYSLDRKLRHVDKALAWANIPVKHFRSAIRSRIQVLDILVARHLALRRTYAKFTPEQEAILEEMQSIAFKLIPEGEAAQEKLRSQLLESAINNRDMFKSFEAWKIPRYFGKLMYWLVAGRVAQVDLCIAEANARIPHIAAMPKVPVGTKKSKNT